MINVEKLSYYNIIKEDLNEHNSCSFEWQCENCDKSLCMRIVGIADFPTVYGHFKILTFINNKDKKDHVMVVKGDVFNKENTLIRLHSSCLTGDVLGSLRCDCGAQLHKSLSIIETEGLGAVLYMQQEGRGIGLSNKIKAYMLQDQGFDTYDANVFLGYRPDERQYEIAAAMLKKLELTNIRLLTNNPNKIKELKRYGITIKKRISLESPPNEYNHLYLMTKKERLGHLLSIN